jgi:hypothetical protein
VGQQDDVWCAQELAEAGQDVLDGGLSPDRSVGDAMHVLDIRRNGHSEIDKGLIKEEEVNLSEYQDYHDAYQQIGQFLDDVYMRKRIRSSLGYITSLEFGRQASAQDIH